MTTVLITGVAGLLGSNLADWIIDNHPDVTIVGIDNLSGGYLENVDARVIFYNADLAKSNLNSIFARHKPDIVYHFAAYAAEALSPFIRKYNYTNNLVATSSVVNQCIVHSVKRLVFTSSMSIYGSGTPPFAETDRRAPIDPYGVAKSACEMDIEIAGAQHGLDYCIIRPHNFYGAKQNIWDSYRNVLGIWMYKRLTDSPITVFGDGSQLRAFSYIDDSLPCLWKAGTLASSSRQIINLGGTVPITIKNAAELVIEVTGGGEIVHLPPRHEVHHAIPTWRKSETLLDYKHLTDMKTGLTKMWEWAKEQPLRPRQVWDKYEVDAGLYPYWETGLLKEQAASSVSV